MEKTTYYVGVIRHEQENVDKIYKSDDWEETLAYFCFAICRCSLKRELIIVMGERSTNKIYATYNKKGGQIIGTDKKGGNPNESLN